MLASTKIGLWKRNGAPVEGQQYIYHSPLLGSYQKKNDLLLMQVSAKLGRFITKINPVLVQTGSLSVETERQNKNG